MTVAARSAAAPPSPSRLRMLWGAAIGKKVLMALTGIILSLYVLVHMLGNLQLYLGQDATGAYVINNYAKFLHNNAALLWGTRTVLLVAVLVHAIAGIQLHLTKSDARPVDYHMKQNVNSTFSSRTMIWTGILIGAFAIYHLLHLTGGQVHPDFIPLDPHHNLVVGLARGGAALAYVIGMIALGFHLRHGLYSLFQSLGAGNPAISQTALSWAALVGAVIAVVNLSFPLAVLVGLVK